MRFPVYALSLALFLAIAGTSWCDPEYYHPGTTGEAIPNVELPPGVVVPPDEIGLFADFSAGDERGVPLYLVNRTSQPVAFPAQDNDIFLKLEVQTQEGWVRAQAHEYSWCGNSYGQSVLQPGMHWRLYGYRPKEGRQSAVRYALYSGQKLVSNAGSGLVPDSAVALARNDEMALRGLPWTLREAFPADVEDESRMRMSPKQRVVCLELLHAYGEVPAIAYRATLQVAAWKAAAKLSDEKSAALTTMQEILSRPRNAKPSAGRLLIACLDKVEKAPANPSADTDIAWQVIRDLADLEHGSEGRAPAPDRLQAGEENWKRAVECALKHIAASSDLCADCMNNLLSHGSLLDSLVSSERLESLISGAAYGAARAAADALVRRGRTERLAELGRKLSARSQGMILASMITGGTRHGPQMDYFELRDPPIGSQADAFLIRCVTIHPGEVAVALRALRAGTRGVDSFGRTVPNAIRAYLRKEVQRSTQAGAAFDLTETISGLRAALALVDEAKSSDDIPLLQSLLGYNGYVRQEGSRSNDGSGEMKSYVEECYLIRQDALYALRRRGMDVPRDIVIARDVTDPAHIVEKKSGDE